MQFIIQAFRKATYYKRWCILLFLVCGGLSFSYLSYANPYPTNFNSANFQDGDSIKVTLKVSRTSLRQVIRLIEKQTGLTFAISSTVLDNARSITLQANKQPLTTVLRRIFTNTGYAFEIRNKQIIIYPEAETSSTPGITRRPVSQEAEKYVVTGLITDGERPLAGVSIREKDTHSGASTNENGRFRIPVVNGQAVLQFSLIGYEAREISLRDRKTLEIVLQNDPKTLNDLVIIGYGLHTKANITGAITKVEGRRLKSRPVTNVMAALQGTAPGLLVTRNNGQPGKEGFNLQIRGLSSGNYSEPLVLVDGAPGSISLLNPNDIESISVLKDAAAASIYGPLAAGGVVLVTTKRGKSGKVAVEYSSLFGIETPISMPRRMRSWQAASLQNEATGNAGLQPVWTSRDIELLKDPAINYLPRLDGTQNFNYYDDIDPLDDVTRGNSTTSTYNLTARGGNSDHQYLFSFGQFSRQGLFNTGWDKTSRTNLQANFNNRFSDILSLETSLQYAKSNTLSPGWRVDGNYGILNFLYQQPGSVPLYVPGSNKYTAGYNGHALLKDGGKRDERTSYADAVFTLKAENLYKGLTLKAVYSPQLTTTHDGLGKRTVNFYNGDGYVNGVNDPNTLKRGYLLEVQHSLQLLADYDLSAGKANTVHILGGYAYESHYQHQRVRIADRVSENEMSQMSFNDPLLATSRHFKGSGSLASVFTRINYNYKDRYLLEANLVASQLSYNSTQQKKMQREHLYPSFSAGWRLNNEKWFASAFRFVDEFKLRASWGMLGNFNWRSGLNDFNYRDQLLHPAGYPLIYYEDNDRYIPGNNNWETVSTTNAGLDLTLFKGRLNINADYFVKHNSRMQIAEQTFPQVNWLAPRFYNAVLRSWGWELNVGWRDNRGPFSYWVNANIFDDQNKILSTSGPSAWLNGNNRGLSGLPYNAIIGYQAQGYFQRPADIEGHAYQGIVAAPGDIRYVDVNNDGKIDGGSHTQGDHGDLVYLGSSQPRYSFGFDAGSSCKGFDFSIFFQGIGARKVLVPGKYAMPFVDGWQQPWLIHTDHWSPTNQNAEFPRLYSGNSPNLQPSSFWVMNASYIRLKNLQVGYTFHFDRSHPLVNSLRVYFSGQDLWEANRMRIRYYDPEQATNIGYQYPFFRSFTIGLNASF
ncbi:SusC/RagA family TonB-linked outer membrane protein [Chitinophaga rhizophila]|uniref:SusC/RagA family TonB-linked outer membrane protein n=1 Tax=Chitinophaga rhizophila TaxID=2866212 RepID=A0ABS7GLF1_9BACT|nr:SusC/RagA family TonB-linked outer membrane protein [Chitinophaga rhizophila]MBW8687614.1 SusC/RagA family TonB-linked outer membrane protein [Chitinophaga rhizophila]